MRGKRNQALALRCLLAVGMVCLLCGADWAKSIKTWEFNIPRQKVETALTALAQQTGTQLLFPYDAVSSQEVNPLTGRHTLTEALEIMLRDTGLAGDVTASGVITVSQEKRVTSGSEGEDMESKHNTGVLAGIATAILSIFSAPNAAGQEASTGEESQRVQVVEEIIVTAQKRSERLQDVPIPVTAISGAELLANNQLRLQDYALSIPGLNLTPNVQSIQSLSIRGITTGGGTNPTVGIVVDDVQYGASTGFGTGSRVPEIDPGMLERVEVLRGPQGTLYGASSMGGLLKFVTTDPSTEYVSGRLQSGVVGIDSGSDLGYNVRGSINVPLSNTLATRISGFKRKDPGYVDNVLLNIDGINESEVSGGQLTTLWRLSDLFSVRLGALYQQDRGDGNSEVDLPPPGDGELQQATVYGAGAYNRKAQAYSLTIDATFGAVDATILSGYNQNQFSDSFDFSHAFGSFGEALFGVSGTPVLTQGDSKKFTQELRFQIPIRRNIDWLIGAFYTNEDNVLANQIPVLDPLSGVVAGYAFNSKVASTLEEIAAFTNFTFHITDRLKVQVGGRQSEIDQTSQNTTIGVYAADAPIPPSMIGPKSATEGDAFTYLVTPQLSLSEELMVYARFASGYRVGGANNNPGGVAPVAYDPDRTYNYEIGAKGSFFDGVLSVDGSIYYIDWEGIQIQLNRPSDQTSYTDNGGNAESKGVELSFDLRPRESLTVSGWVVRNSAVLSEDFPATSSAYGLAGDRLPDSSRFSSHLSVQQGFPLFGGSALIGGLMSYVDDRKGVFTGTEVRETLPSYWKLDLFGTLTYDSWVVDVYINNAADERGVLTGGLGASPRYTYLRPRTVGLNVAKSF